MDRDQIRREISFIEARIVPLRRSSLEVSRVGKAEYLILPDGDKWKIKLGNPRPTLQVLTCRSMHMQPLHLPVKDSYSALTGRGSG